MKQRILLLEDDRSLGEILSERLTQEGYELKWVRSVEQAKAEFTRAYDLAIFDIHLPDGSGLSIAETWKKANDTPFLFMTALSDPETRLEGFELGAEEFIPKPFHLKELLLRVAHVLENHKPLRQLALPDCVVDFQALIVKRKDGKELKAAAKDIELLQYLIRRAPAVISRDELLETLWGQKEDSSHRTIDNMVVRLRDLLGSEGLIRSVRGVGYQWSGGKNGWQT